MSLTFQYLRHEVELNQTQTGLPTIIFSSPKVIHDPFMSYVLAGVQTERTYV